MATCHQDSRRSSPVPMDTQSTYTSSNLKCRLSNSNLYSLRNQDL